MNGERFSRSNQLFQHELFFQLHVVAFDRDADFFSFFALEFGDDFFQGKGRRSRNAIDGLQVISAPDTHFGCRAVRYDVKNGEFG